MADPQKPNPGMTFLGFSGGALAIVLALVIIVPVFAIVVCCGGSIIGAAITPTTSPTP